MVFGGQHRAEKDQECGKQRRKSQEDDARAGRRLRDLPVSAHALPIMGWR